MDSGGRAILRMLPRHLSFLSGPDSPWLISGCHLDSGRSSQFPLSPVLASGVGRPEPDTSLLVPVGTARETAGWFDNGNHRYETWPRSVLFSASLGTYVCTYYLISPQHMALLLLGT